MSDPAPRQWSEWGEWAQNGYDGAGGGRGGSHPVCRVSEEGGTDVFNLEGLLTSPIWLSWDCCSVIVEE